MRGRWAGDITAPSIAPGKDDAHVVDFLRRQLGGPERLQNIPAGAFAAVRAPLSDRARKGKQRHPKPSHENCCDGDHK